MPLTPENNYGPGRGKITKELDLGKEIVNKHLENDAGDTTKLKKKKKKGKLSPPTKAGFRRTFAAWIVDDDLPWTTGQAPMLFDGLLRRNDLRGHQ
ncbi:hypothetical protein MD484_g8499, partial [Candolleomyces efflorescens]